MGRAVSPLTIVAEWQDAVNRQEIERLLAISTPDITIIGPRGRAQGHEILRNWVSRAGLSLTTERAFVRGAVVVVGQQGVWRSVDSGEVIGESSVASWFLVADGRVSQVARYDSLEEALGEAGLGYEDEVAIP